MLTKFPPPSTFNWSSVAETHKELRKSPIGTHFHLLPLFSFHGLLIRVKGWLGIQLSNLVIFLFRGCIPVRSRPALKIGQSHFITRFQFLIEEVDKLSWAIPVFVLSRFLLIFFKSPLKLLNNCEAAPMHRSWSGSNSYANLKYIS